MQDFDVLIHHHQISPVDFTSHRHATSPGEPGRPVHAETGFHRLLALAILITSRIVDEQPPLAFNRRLACLDLVGDVITGHPKQSRLTGLLIVVPGPAFQNRIAACHQTFKRGVSFTGEQSS